MTVKLADYEEYIEILEKSRKSKDTIRAYDHNIKRFLEHFNVESCEKLDKIKYKDFILYQNHLLESGLSESSANTHFRNIKAFLNYLLKCEMITSNAINKIKPLKEPQKIRELLSDEEVEMMIEKSETIEEKLIIALMYATGVRRSELVNIKRSDIINQHVMILGKGRKQRKLFIQNEVFELLNKYLDTHNGEYIFYSNKRKEGNITTETVRLRVKKAAELAGIDPRRIENISPHSIRRSFASYHLNSGSDSFLVRDLLGHSSSATTARYAKIYSPNMDNALANHNFAIK
jgi:site-specific recombinase XerD